MRTKPDDEDTLVAATPASPAVKEAAVPGGDQFL